MENKLIKKGVKRNERKNPEQKKNMSELPNAAARPCICSCPTPYVLCEYAGDGKREMACRRGYHDEAAMKKKG